jgi:hypothetical protein
MNVATESAMKRVCCLLLSSLFLSAVFAIPGGEFWEKKEFKQWSLKECDKILTDSPWARLLPLSGVGIMDNNRTSSDGQQPFVNYQVQFRSASPIRQAMVRKQMIQAKYDTLPKEQQQQLDKQSETFINSFPEDSVVVYVEYSTNDNVRVQELRRYWQSKTTELLKTTVFLSGSKGDKVPLSRFAAAQGADLNFTFIFPREVNGKPVIGPQDKSVKLEFAYPVINGLGNGQAFMEFKTEKMIFNGNIAY